MKRAIGATFALLLIAAGVFLVPTLFGQPWSIRHFFLRDAISFVAEHPMLLSYARPLDAWNLDFYSDDLEDYSVAGDLRIQDQIDEVLVGLRQYDRDSLDGEDRLSYDILEWILATQQQGRAFVHHTYPLNQFRGAQSSLPDFMINIHAVEDEDDARSYLARVAAFDTALEQMRTSVVERAERGFLPPRFVLQAVIDETTAFAASPATENVLYTHLATALDDIPEMTPAERASLLEELQSTIETGVRPGYRALTATLRALAKSANDDDGAWKHPDGDAYYRWTLRWHTTTEQTPREIHEMGLAEIARIHAEMSRILAAEGLPADEPIATLLELNRDARFLYPDDDDGRAQILADYGAMIDEVEGRLPDYFGKLPQAEVVVERVPPFKEEGSAGAYYNPPSLDGSRPGVFYANLRDVSEVQKFRMRTLAFHEAVPGHHLQVALAMETSDLPLFRRFLPMTAFIEGWALYAERVALEEGFHQTPYEELGALSAELFRAARLVVDTGIHAMHWTRERAVDFLVDQAGLPRGDAVAEVERYIVEPGQACAYKVGQLKILELREEARNALGDDFDLRAFHDVILRGGAVPLGVLDEVVVTWIAEQRDVGEEPIP